MDTSTSSESEISRDTSQSTIYADINEENLQSYLTQFQECHNWNPSDDSDFEDTSYEIDMEYDNEKQQEMEEKIYHEEEIRKIREANMKKYFDIYKNKSKSIFNLKGIRFTIFNHKLIYFIFTPSAFCKKYICAHRKYYVSLIYDNKWWNLKRFQVPNKDDILNLFKHPVTDKSVTKVIYKVYLNLVEFTKVQIETRKNKHMEYLLGKEIFFNCDDEKLLLTPDEIKRRKEKMNDTWNRMLPPPNS